MATSKSFLAKEWEKNSDDAKRVLFQKTNKWHAARGILLTESGLWDLQHHEREKALYTERKLGNQDQWKEERAESLISEHFVTEPENDQDDWMFVLTPLKITAKDYCATKRSYRYQRKGPSSKKLKLEKKTKKHSLK